MPEHDAPPNDSLDQLLRRDAARVQVGASTGFADRLKRAAVAAEEPLPFPRGDHSPRWPWYALAAAAVLLLGVGLPLLEGPSPISSPPADGTPVAKSADHLLADGRVDPESQENWPSSAPRLAAIELNPFSAVEATPLGLELDAIGHDVRRTGAFLLACLPDYPAPR